jgi:hypothetical protein
MKSEDDVIANLDETPININMPPNYTITKKGKKNVIIRIQGQEKCRVYYSKKSFLYYLFNKFEGA